MPSSDKYVEVTSHYLLTMMRKWNSSLSQGKKPDYELLKQLWGAVHAVLRAYCRGMNFTRDGVPKEHFPVELADFLADQVDYILQGKTPAPIKDMVRHGSPGTGPSARRNIGVAIAYIHAAKTGLIKDKHPVKTISDIYGVTDRAVRYWKTKYRNHQSDFFPGLDSAELAVRLALSVKAAGLRYQKEVRGSKGRVNYPRPNKQ